MKYLVIICLFFLSCTDDRPLDTDEFEARPSFETNVFQTQYSAGSINTGNDSIAVPNTIHDYIDVNFLNEEFNADYLERLRFTVLAENSIDQPQNLDFIFFDNNDVETFRVTEPIPAGSTGNPTLKEFSVDLNTEEIEIITSSVRAEFFVTQPSTANNSGTMQLECIVEGGYLFSGE